MSRPKFLAALSAVLVATAVLGPRLSADQERPTSTGAAQGELTGECAIVETKSGSLAVLGKPELRSLGGRTFIVGETLSLEGVSDAESVFAPTRQWLSLDDVRRFWEVGREKDMIIVRENLKKTRDQKREHP
jgi:hypothetical protein